MAAVGVFAVGGPAMAADAFGPQNTVTIVDPSPVNWLSVTWNTMEEVLRVDNNGLPQNNLASEITWVDPQTLEMKLRHGVMYQDGTPFSAKNVKTAFDKVQDTKNPHPPGAFLNFPKDAKVEIVSDDTVRMNFPERDGAALMSLRGMHIPSDAFWAKLGFVDKKTGSATGHW